MEFKLLDPTNDAVFKILLTRYEVLLRDMIESVLELQSPIEGLVFANPEVPKDYPADMGIVRDVLVRLGDATLAFAKESKRAKLKRWARFLRARTLEELEV